MVVIDHIEYATTRYRLWLADDVALQEAPAYFNELLPQLAPRLDAVVYERFRLSYKPELQADQAGSEMPSSQVIGMIKSAAQRAGVLTKLVVQAPSDRRSMLIPPLHLLRLSSPHTRDAYMHARYYVRMHRGDD